MDQPQMIETTNKTTLLHVKSIQYLHKMFLFQVSIEKGSLNITVQSPYY